MCIRDRSITDGIPAHDMMRVKRYMLRYKKEDKMILTGPNCAGTITPGEAMIGIMPGHFFTSGDVGVIGRSGTLGYEAASQMKAEGFLPLVSRSLHILLTSFE